MLSLLFLPRISFGNKPSIISSREIFFILFWNGILYCYGMCFLGRQIWHSSSWLLYRDTGVKMYIFSEVFSSFAANSLDYLKWKGDFLKSFFHIFLFSAFIFHLGPFAQWQKTIWHQKKIVVLVSLQDTLWRRVWFFSNDLSFFLFRNIQIRFRFIFYLY